jgi:hypothetical protein
MLSSTTSPAASTGTEHHRIRSGSGSGSGSLLESLVNAVLAVPHRRTGSGSLLASIAGPSNRVQPTALVEDAGNAELDNI